MWIRTKKWGTGVSQVLKYSTGVSRSTKRKERRIMPSSPGKSTDCGCGSAQDKMEGDAAASTAAEICLTNLRLEVMRRTSMVSASVSQPVPVPRRTLYRTYTPDVRPRLE